MTVRLDSVAPDLVQTLAVVDDAAKRRVAGAVAEFAVRRTGLGDRAAEEGLCAVRSGMLGDSEQRSGVHALAESLDERYWELQEQAEKSGEDPGEYLLVFAQARAASAVDFALDADSNVAAQEASYEALTAVGDLPELWRVVRRVIDSAGPGEQS